MSDDTALSRDVPAPPARFNFAQHLIERNAGRPTRPTFVDDGGTLSNGELEQRLRRLASGLLGLVRRLRGKLDDPFEQKLLHTIRGMGYVLEDREP